MCIQISVAYYDEECLSWMVSIYTRSFVFFVLFIFCFNLWKHEYFWHRKVARNARNRVTPSKLVIRSHWQKVFIFKGGKYSPTSASQSKK